MKNEARPGFLLYLDDCEPLTLLTDAERGRLLSAVISYVRSGQAPAFTGKLKMAWGFLRPSLDRDSQRYEERSERSRAAAEARWGKKRKAAGECGRIVSDAADANPTPAPAPASAPAPAGITSPEEAKEKGSAGRNAQPVRPFREPAPPRGFAAYPASPPYRRTERSRDGLERLFGGGTREFNADG